MSEAILVFGGKFVKIVAAVFVRLRSISTRRVQSCEVHPILAFVTHNSQLNHCNPAAATSGVVRLDGFEHMHADSADYALVMQT